jgi:hypothetical protein
MDDHAPLFGALIPERIAEMETSSGITPLTMIIFLLVVLVFALAVYVVKAFWHKKNR